MRVNYCIPLCMYFFAWLHRTVRKGRTCTLCLRKGPLPGHNTDGEENRLAPCSRGRALYLSTTQTEKATDLHLAPEEGPSTCPPHRRRRRQTCTLHLRKGPLTVHHTDGEGDRLAPCTWGRALYLPTTQTEKATDLHLAPEEGPSTCPSHRRRRRQTCTLHLRKGPLPVHHTDGEGNTLASCTWGRALYLSITQTEKAIHLHLAPEEGPSTCPSHRRRRRQTCSLQWGRALYLSITQTEKATELCQVRGYIGPSTCPPHRRRRQQTCTLHLRKGPLPFHQTEKATDFRLVPGYIVPSTCPPHRRRRRQTCAWCWGVVSWVWGPPHAHLRPEFIRISACDPFLKVLYGQI